MDRRRKSALKSRLRRLLIEWVTSDEISDNLRAKLGAILRKTVGRGELSEFHPGKIRVFRGTGTSYWMGRKKKRGVSAPTFGARSWAKDVKAAKLFGRDLVTRVVTRKVPAIDVDKVLGKGYSENEVILGTGKGMPYKKWITLKRGGRKIRVPIKVKKR